MQKDITQGDRRLMRRPQNLVIQLALQKHIIYKANPIFFFYKFYKLLIVLNQKVSFLKKGVVADIPAPRNWDCDAVTPCLQRSAHEGKTPEALTVPSFHLDFEISMSSLLQSGSLGNAFCKTIMLQCSYSEKEADGLWIHKLTVQHTSDTPLTFIRVP